MVALGYCWIYVCFKVNISHITRPSLCRTQSGTAFRFHSQGTKHCTVLCASIWMHDCVFTIHVLLHWHQAHYINPHTSSLQTAPTLWLRKPRPFVAFAAQKPTMFLHVEIMYITLGRALQLLYWNGKMGFPHHTAHIVMWWYTETLNRSKKSRGRKRKPTNIKCHSNKSPGNSASWRSKEGTDCLI